MHVIMVRWTIKPEHVETFEAAMRAHIRATRASEPGCLRFDVALAETEPRTYHLFEVYADDRALEDHARSPTLAGLRALAPVWVETRAYATGTLWASLED